MTLDFINENIILSLKDFSLSFINDDESNLVVNDVSFNLKKGTTLGIVGESGSGKTVTTLSLIKLLNYPPAKIISGKAILKTDNSKVDLLSLNQNQLIKYRGKKISCIFQTPMTSLNPSMRCGKQVEEMFKIHSNLSKKESYLQTIELFKEVNLPRPEHIYRSYPFEISGGQRQRVMIAMAIACKPDILIADEPTTALDVVVQKNIIELLIDLQKKYGTSIIFISHNLGIIKEIADYTLVMKNGEVVEYGTTDQIFNNPQNTYTMGLIACKPNVYYKLKKLPTVEEIENLHTQNSNFNVKDYINSLKIEEDYKLENNKEGLEENKRENLLEIKDLCVYYKISNSLLKKNKKYVKAVNNVNLQIKKGETLGLLGESGCGKSSLSRAIIGLEEPTSGEIFFEGAEISNSRKKNKTKVNKDIQMIFQDPYSSLNPKKTVGSALLEPLKVHNIFNNKKDQKDRIFYLLDKVGLKSSDINKYPHEFSGGQRQRICIARALTMNPKLLICDEPVSSLDVSVQAMVLNLLAQLKEELDLTILFISHDVAVVRHISDKIAVMKDGIIIEVNDPINLIYNQSNDYINNLIKSSL
ncbi:MAG: dipeptide ABC transporter ATP-binding protein [Bacteroidales bacterium]